MPNSVTHFEIYAQNSAGVAEFYRNTFGWRIEQLPGIDYWRVDTGSDQSSDAVWLEGECIATQEDFAGFCLSIAEPCGSPEGEPHVKRS